MVKTLLGFMLALMCAVSAGAQIRTVQHNSGFSSGGTSVAVLFKGNVTSGNVLFVAVSTYAGQTLSAPTDSQGNAYALAATATNPGNSAASIYVDDGREHWSEYRHLPHRCVAQHVTAIFMRWRA